MECGDALMVGGDGVWRCLDGMWGWSVEMP